MGNAAPRMVCRSPPGAHGCGWNLGGGLSESIILDVDVGEHDTSPVLEQRIRKGKRRLGRRGI